MDSTLITISERLLEAAAPSLGTAAFLFVHVHIARPEGGDPTC
jgi:hypothetical protein